MRESTRPARERIIATEVLKLELRTALERSRRIAADRGVPATHGLARTAGRDAPR